MCAHQRRFETFLQGRDRKLLTGLGRRPIPGCSPGNRRRHSLPCTCLLYIFYTSLCRFHSDAGLEDMRRSEKIRACFQTTQYCIQGNSQRLCVACTGLSCIFYKSLCRFRFFSPRATTATANTVVGTIAPVNFAAFCMVHFDVALGHLVNTPLEVVVMHSQLPVIPCTAADLED